MTQDLILRYQLFKHWNFEAALKKTVLRFFLPNPLPLSLCLEQKNGRYLVNLLFSNYDLVGCEEVGLFLPDSGLPPARTGLEIRTDENTWREWQGSPDCLKFFARALSQGRVELSRYPFWLRVFFSMTRIA